MHKLALSLLLLSSMGVPKAAIGETKAQLASISATVFAADNMMSLTTERRRYYESQERGMLSPEETIRSFIATLNKADLKLAAAFVDGGKPGNAVVWFEDMMRQDRWTYTATDFRTKIDGTSAVVRVRTKLSCDTQIGPQVPLANEEILKLRRVGTEWKIVPEEATAKNVPGYGMVQRAAMMLARDESGQARERN